MKQSWFSVLAMVVSLALSCTTIPAVAQAPDPAHTAAGNAAGLPSGRDWLPGDSAGWWAAVQEEIRVAEYGVTWQQQTYLPDLAAAYQAPNRAHNLRTYFTTDGVRLIPRQFDGDTPPWELSLILAGYGYAGASVPSPGTPTLHVSGNRIDYGYPDESHVDGWYANSERGLEQGFTLAAPPAIDGRRASSSLILEVVAGGDLAATSTAAGSAVEFSAPGGHAVLRYAGLAVTDAAGRSLPARLDVEAQQPGGSRARRYVLRITIDATAARYPITVAPTLTGLSTTPDWTAEGDQDGGTFGTSVATAGDVNADGYSDIVVGAPGYDNGQANEGRAFVYHGSASGLAATAAWTAESDQENAGLGNVVATAGDVNGDGYADVIVGAVGYDNGQLNEGRTFVYHGSATGLSASPAWTAEGDQAAAGFGYSAATAGDVNGDGYDDDVVGAPFFDSVEGDEGQVYVYHGGVSGLSATPAWTVEGVQFFAEFGRWVGPAGDANGDGYGDVVVGAPLYDVNQGDEGQAYVYHGSATGLSTIPAWTVAGDQPWAQFGTSPAAAGDVNGDGYTDVVVGAPSYDVTYSDEGRVYVYHGSGAGLSTTPALTLDGDQPPARFGESVAAAGDVNGDGYADVIVGAPYYDSGLLAEGRAYVYQGSASGLVATDFWTVAGETGYAALGSSVATAGDVNGDGYGDVIIGAPHYDGDQMVEGRAYVYHGGPSSLSATPGWMAESDQAGASFGWSVGTAGDVNGDGYGDILVGAPWYDNGQEDEGRAYVYHGSASGPGITPAWLTEGNLVYAYLGWSVSTAGDVNGDGYDDVIVGAPNHDGAQLDEGRAYVYLGSASGLAATADWIAGSGQEFAWFGRSVATAGDVNGDGYGDIIVGAPGYDNGQVDEGLAYVYHGGASGLSTTPAWTAESDQPYAGFGASVGTAGDVNGDGYGDVVVGAYDVEMGDGWAYAYHGSASGLSTTPNWTAESDQAYAEFGASGGTAGDVNGDGYGDIIIGAPGYDNGQVDEGRAFAYHGGASGLSTTPVWTAESDQAGAYLGGSVATAGDVNGDGYADVIIGAPGYDAVHGEEGRAYVYHGGLLGLATAPAWMADGDQLNAHLGRSVATAGDVNGDGYADVVVGAPYYDSGEGIVGAALVYYGNGGDGLDLLPRQMRAGGSTPIAHLSKSDSPTLFQVRLTGHMPLGRHDVRLEWQAAPLGTLFTDPGVLTGVSDWTDVGTGGTVISQDVTNLSPGVPYHWRARLVYRPGNALGQPAGRWVHIPWDGWHETGLRTNRPPEAIAGPDQGADVLAPVTLDGIESFDWDGDYPLAYAWTQIGGPSVTFTPNLSVTTFTAPATPAVLTFTLNVTDALGLPAPAPDTTVVTVADVPVAGLSLASNSPTPYGTPTVLTATVASGSNVLFTWNWGDGQTGSSFQPVATTRVISHTYAIAGEYTAVVTATNSAGTQHVSTPVVVVAPPACLVPLESVSIDGLLTAFTGLTWTFSAAVAPPGATLPVTYTWLPLPDSGQGTAAAAYSWAATGPVTLTVLAENCGGTASASLGVQVISELTATVDPAITTTIVYTDPQVATTTIVIPPGAVSDMVTLVFSPNPAPTQPLPDGQLFADHAFDLDAYLGETLLPGLIFSTPIHVEVNYTDQDVAGIDETTLQLYYWSGSAWVDGAATCSPPSAYSHDLAANRLSVDICHLTEWIISGAQRIVTRYLYLPVVLRHSVVAPDLVVESLTPTAGGMQVVLRNQGSGPVVDEFWVDVYINPGRPPERMNETWEQLGDQGLVWGVTSSALPLGPGAALTLTVGDAYFAAAYSHLVWPLLPGTPVYAQADSAGDQPHGGVLEIHEILEEEYNNILGPVWSLSGLGLAPPTAHPSVVDDSLPPREPQAQAP